ncbi:FAD-dependent oxidoreductase [Candidimonas nitroreducens]|uniref:Pyridine nucleotide-disulfide oxidoreductase n=1 Tax=Candidimonas nitroreducens TaxID=683354 RepID=A0A225M888_9BURK|nr:FAD-dependent oxidoreductase [Candidimonas nitroreducens]OWT57547.1 pyridine nucleotide-disulfide oxidoreductase [Candidimonas nitroreducens]
MSDQAETGGPDLASGIAQSDLQEGGMIAGHVGDQSVLLARHEGKLYALDAKCTHYGAPLADGAIIDCTLRCPWHHARFDLSTGAAVGAPALQALSCWKVEISGDKMFVRERVQPPEAPRRTENVPTSVVIVGGGAAGEAAAEMLRHEGYGGPVTILSDDSAPPCDRPNLSKDYLAGTAQADWIPLRDADFYREHEIELRLKTQVTAIEPAASQLRLADGSTLGYGALLLATGAEPVRLKLPGADLPHIHYLRTQADCEAIIAGIEAGAKRAVVVGASFIGLEVAAALRQRDIETHVVAPDARPLERVMGPELGDFIRALHESKGVVFHLQQSVTGFEADAVVLQSGERLACDIVVVGVGVRARTALAEAAGLDVDHGVMVNEYLQTSVANIYAAGDIARWPDPYSGERMRVEHWAVAQRQGQAAARNMLGAKQAFTQAPFFWSQHYDAAINYVGHAAHWDRIETDGDASKYDFSARYIDAGRTAALATIYRDIESLKEEAAMEAQAGR